MLSPEPRHTTGLSLQESTMAIDFSPMVKAGLTKTEFAGLLDITRVTVHRWVEDGKEPTPYLRKAVDDLLRTLQKTIDKGLLPGQLEELPPSRHTMDERRKIIDSAIEAVRS